MIRIRGTGSVSSCRQIPGSAICRAWLLPPPQVPQTHTHDGDACWGKDTGPLAEATWGSRPPHSASLGPRVLQGSSPDVPSPCKNRLAGRTQLHDLLGGKQRCERDQRPCTLKILMGRADRADPPTFQNVPLFWSPLAEAGGG